MLTIKFGPLITAEEAKNKTCPAMTRGPATHFCCADKCAWWMWLEDVRHGTLSHKQFMALMQDYEHAHAKGERLGFCCK